MSGLERGPACHSERSEESGAADAEILRFAQNDRYYLQMSAYKLGVLDGQDTQAGPPH